jgi:hypothetical protein
MKFFALKFAPKAWWHSFRLSGIEESLRERYELEHSLLDSQRKALEVIQRIRTNPNAVNTEQRLRAEHTLNSTTAMLPDVRERITHLLRLQKTHQRKNTLSAQPVPSRTM